MSKSRQPQMSAEDQAAVDAADAEAQRIIDESKLSRPSDGQRQKFGPAEREAKRRERFLKLAPKRMTKAIKAIRAVANMANKGAYSYNDDEVEKIRKALIDAVEYAVRDFSRVETKEELFTL